MNCTTKTSLFYIPLLLFSSSAPSCISIPERAYVVSHRGGDGPAGREALCVGEREKEFALSGDAGDGGVDPRGFTLFSWNTMKGGREGWPEDFTRLAAGADLLALQEAWLSEELRSLLDQGGYQWDLTAAFLSGDRETGVLTGARAAPDFVCAARYAEPLVLIPKTILVSRYPLKGTAGSLLVANVHLINFTVDMVEYRKQLRGLEEILSAHGGPLLLTGDFNTWSDGRAEEVHSLAARLTLREVDFEQDQRASFFGRPVDHVFYRGLESVEARAVPVVSSDHNPLLVTFRVPVAKERP